MRGRCAVILGGLAIAGIAATSSWSAQPASRALESETLIVPADDLEVGNPGSDASDIDDQDGAESQDEVETFEVDPPDPGTGTASGLPEIQYDPSDLPAPVRRLREQIIDAAVTGDIEKLREVFDANEGPPAMSATEMGDPIEQLLSLSGDSEGREILAILIEVLDAGYVHVDAGTPDEMFIWPYFARYPLESLNGPQMVELFKLLTAGDYEDMKIYGVYLFYRVGIDPKGVWRYFLAGD